MNLLEGVKCFTGSLGIWHQRITIRDYIIRYGAQILHHLKNVRYHGTATDYWHCSLHSELSTEHKNPNTAPIIAQSLPLLVLKAWVVFPYSGTHITEWIFHIDFFQINVYFECIWLTRSSSMQCPKGKNNWNKELPSSYTRKVELMIRKTTTTWKDC